MQPGKSGEVKTAKCPLPFGTKTFLSFWLERFQWSDRGQGHREDISVGGEVDTNNEVTCVHMCTCVGVWVTAPGNHNRVWD